jgi:hypothetical protein
MRPLTFATLAVPAILLAAVGSGCETTVTTLQNPGGGGSSTSSTTITTSGGTNFGACTRSYECELRAPGCCGYCGEPTLDVVEPINESLSQAFYDATCGEENPACPDCAAGYNANLYAYCNQGQCAEADVVTEPWNTCNEASDCTLRVGTACCESCSLGDISNLIAIPFGEAALLDQVCDGEPAPCPPCAPTYPSEAEAICLGGVCQVAWSF